MKLWLLARRKDLPETDDPWEPWYDKAFGFVVRAATEKEARAIADAHGGAETITWRSGGNIDAHPWLSGAYSICVELLAEGDAGLVMEDVHAA